MKTTLLLAALSMASLACNRNAPDDGHIAIAFDGMPGLSAHAPSGTEVARNAVGLGVMLKGPDVSMTIGTLYEGDPETLEEAKKNAQSYSPTNLETEELSDGFILTYTSEGNMGTNYWLVGRRNIDGKTYTCGVKSPKKPHQQTAIAICKSLKK